MTTRIGLQLFHGWTRDGEPGQLVKRHTGIQRFRIEVSPHMIDWDAGEAVRHVKRVRRLFPDAHTIISLAPEGAGQEDERFLPYTREIIDHFGADFYLIDSETSNPRFAPGGDWRRYVDAMEPVIDLVHERGGLIAGPGSTSVKELGDLDNILGEFTRRGSRLDVATVHNYPEPWPSAWPHFIRMARQAEYWRGFTRLANEQKKILLRHGYDFGLVTETGVQGRPQGFWQSWTDPGDVFARKLVYEQRQAKRMRLLLDRFGDPFWKGFYLYQITEGPNVLDRDAGWGITTETGPGTWRMKECAKYLQSGDVPRL